MKKIKEIFVVFLIWRVFLFGIQYFSTNIPYRDSFPYVEAVLNKYEPSFLRPWGNFDGVHYINISKAGYFAQYTQAFFPFYPLLTRWLGNLLFLKNYLLAGQFISSVCFILFLIIFRKLILLDYKEEVAGKTLLFLLLFPSAFFFISQYAESLFLLLVLLSFYLARKGNWWQAGIIAGVASATKVFGVFLFPALLMERYLQSNEEQNLAKKSIGWFSKLRSDLLGYFPAGLSLSGIGFYMIYLKKTFKDSLLFIHAQPAFGASRSVNKIILFYQVLWRYFKMILTVTKTDPLYFTVWIELLAALTFLVLLFVAYRKKIRLSYLVFAAFSYTIPTLTGNFSSMPRYVLVLFPCFMVFGLINFGKFVKIEKFIYFLEVLLTIIFVTFFLRGYWIA